MWRARSTGSGMTQLSRYRNTPAVSWHVSRCGGLPAARHVLRTFTASLLHWLVQTPARVLNHMHNHQLLVCLI
jgi:hypothetical protein